MDKGKIMKKVLIAACLLCLAACGTKEPDNQSLAVGSPDINFKTDRAWYGLLGNVQTVRYGKIGTSSNALRFSEDGKSRQPLYMKVKFEDRRRVELRLDRDPMVNTTFDKLGRVSEVHYDKSKKTENYSYVGNAYYPSEKKTTVVDSLGWKTVKTVKYTYDKNDFDECGNWLRRTENGDTVVRRISYFPDPYAIANKAKYGSAKEVARAFYEAEIARDAEKALSTYEYGFRRLSRMTARDKQEIYEGQDVDKTNIARFSIKGTERITFDDHPVTAVKTKITLDNGRSYTQTIHCYKGTDNNWYRDKFAMNE